MERKHFRRSDQDQTERHQSRWFFLRSRPYSYGVSPRHSPHRISKGNSGFLFLLRKVETKIRRSMRLIFGTHHPFQTPTTPLGSADTIFLGRSEKNSYTQSPIQHQQQRQGLLDLVFIFLLRTNHNVSISSSKIDPRIRFISSTTGFTRTSRNIAFVLSIWF